MASVDDYFLLVRAEPQGKSRNDVKYVESSKLRRIVDAYRGINHPAIYVIDNHMLLS